MTTATEVLLIVLLCVVVMALILQCLWQNYQKGYLFHMFWKRLFCFFCQCCSSCCCPNNNPNNNQQSKLYGHELGGDDHHANQWTTKNNVNYVQQKQQYYPRLEDRNVLFLFCGNVSQTWARVVPEELNISEFRVFTLDQDPDVLPDFVGNIMDVTTWTNIPYGSFDYIIGTFCKCHTEALLHETKLDQFVSMVSPFLRPANTITGESGGQLILQRANTSPYVTLGPSHVLSCLDSKQAQEQILPLPLQQTEEQETGLLEQRQIQPSQPSKKWTYIENKYQNWIFQQQVTATITTTTTTTTTTNNMETDTTAVMLVNNHDSDFPGHVYEQEQRIELVEQEQESLSMFLSSKDTDKQNVSMWLTT